MILLSIILNSFTVKASHLIGGEIVWKCIKSGIHAREYRFYLRVYRACEGISQTGAVQAIFVRNHPTISEIPVTETTRRIIGVPGCEAANAITCGTSVPGVYEEVTYESAPIELGNFIPHKKGWWFYWTTCCRPGSIQNIPTAASGDYILRCAMFPVRKDTSIAFPPSPGFVTAINSNPKSTANQGRNKNIWNAKDCRD